MDRAVFQSLVMRHQVFIWVWFSTHISKIWALPVRCAPLRPRPPLGPVPRLIHGDATRPVCLCHGRPVCGAAGLIQFSAAAGRITAAAWQNCRLARVQYYQVSSISKCRELAKYGVKFHIWYICHASVSIHRRLRPARCTHTIKAKSRRLTTAPVTCFGRR